MTHVPLLGALLPSGHHAQPLPALHLPYEKGIAVTPGSLPPLQEAQMSLSEPKMMHMQVPRRAEG